uniref:Uncharacterized protein n=1 Tax=Sinocyclocheilus anshuiensis TaxID=1608454 RepID=A0A671NGX9_9TELE
MWKAQVRSLYIRTTGNHVTFHTIYPPDYETNTKYFGKTDGFFFEKLVETSHPNRWVKQGRFALFDNTSACILTAAILKLVAEDSGYYAFGVDIKLLPDLMGDEIQLTVIMGENPLTCFIFSMTRKEKLKSHHMTPLIVTLITITNVLTDMKASSLQDEYVKMHSVVLTNSPTARSDRGSVIHDFHRPANTEPVHSTDACYIDFVQPNLDQIYTEINPDVVQESHSHQQPIKITVSSHFSCNSFSVTLYSKVPFVNIS